MTTFKKILITGILAGAIGSTVYEARDAAHLQKKLQAIETEQASANARAAHLAAENQRLSILVVEAKASAARSQSQFQELMKLRARAGLAQTYSRKVQELESSLQEQQRKVPAFLTNAMAMGLSTAQSFGEKEAHNRLLRMKKMLNLSDDQAETIGSILTNQIRRHFQMSFEMMAGKQTRSQMIAENTEDAEKEEAEILAVLNQQQAASYPQFLQAEKAEAAEKAAKSDTSQIAESFKLSADQQDQLRSALYTLHLKEADAPLQQEIRSAKANGKIAEIVSLTMESQKAALERKLKVLEPFLSEEQLAAYHQAQAQQIERLASAMKMLVPAPADSAPK